MGEAWTSESAYRHAASRLHARFEAGEALIATHPTWAMRYAIDILKAPFAAGEEMIAKDAEASARYAAQVLHGPFDRGETVIASDAAWSVYYAIHALRGPFHIGEAAIASDPECSRLYVANVPGVVDASLRRKVPAFPHIPAESTQRAVFSLIAPEVSRRKTRWGALHDAHVSDFVEEQLVASRFHLRPEFRRALLSLTIP